MRDARPGDAGSEVGDGFPWAVLVRAARLSGVEWEHLGRLMEQSGCAAALSDLRAAHPEFDAEAKS
ncbi:hypothetical protein ACH495_19130 [Micromonospora sp. NPDC018662]|uniref:hypothetical protein n=1 Tax=Micromonospora sp. NPDC018662 TaxID=3364238 RepID=UPI00379573BA